MICGMYQSQTLIGFFYINVISGTYPHVHMAIHTQISFRFVGYLQSDFTIITSYKGSAFKLCGNIGKSIKALSSGEIIGPLPDKE